MRHMQQATQWACKLRIQMSHILDAGSCPSSGRLIGEMPVIVGLVLNNSHNYMRVPMDIPCLSSVSKFILCIQYPILKSASILTNSQMLIPKKLLFCLFVYFHQMLNTKPNLT